ncbi:MAG: sigma-70 family RNA polymerase sigma factor [Clostridia bacterium]|nr:sigma-70 family RNA polymerase sigma factor [Clostridia bacterium]
MRSLFEEWVDEYSLPLLKWARGKTGSPAEAEELTQEVWMQFFSAVRREGNAGNAIAQPEHLLWKVARTPEYLRLRTLLVKLIHAGFDPSCVTGEEKFTLAQLIEKGFLFMADDRLTPNFLIFTGAQYDALRETLFAPLAAALRPELESLARDLHELSLSNLPPHLKHLAPLAEAMAQHDVAYMTELLGFRDGTLYQPADKRDGEFLTLAYIN